MLEEVDLNNLLAVDLLEALGNDMPTQAQIDVIEDLISHTTFSRYILQDERLSTVEQCCLAFIADELMKARAAQSNMKTDTLSSHGEAICKKLRASSLKDAVYKSVRFSMIDKYQSLEAQSSYSLSASAIM